MYVREVIYMNLNNHIATSVSFTHKCKHTHTQSHNKIEA